MGKDTDKGKDDLQAATDEAQPPAERTIEWNGQTFTLPPSIDDLPVEAMAAMEEGRGMVFTKLALGDRQWRRFTALGSTFGDGAELMTKILRDGYGLNLGK